MPISATGASERGHRRSRSRGFTLIEILVVVVVIGIIGVTAVQQLNFGGNRDVQRDAARRLHVMLQLAMDEALVQSHTLGLMVTTDGYRFVKRERNKEDKWVWSDYDASGKLSGARFDKDSPLYLDLELEDQPLELKSAVELEAADEPAVPQLWFMPDGELLPRYRLVVSATQAEREYRLEPSEREPITLDVVAR
ncbi:MAG: GspH/FimT family protein [Pseudomonadota bacterium]